MNSYEVLESYRLKEKAVIHPHPVTWLVRVLS